MIRRGDWDTAPPFMTEARRRRRVAIFLSGVGLAFALAVTVIVASWAFDFGRKIAAIPATGSIVVLTQDDLNALLTKRLKPVESDMKVLNDMLAAMKSVPNESELAGRIVALDGEIRLLSDRLQRFEQALGGDPARALELPLIRKDLDAARQVTETNIQMLREGVALIYDINKWVLGAVAVALMSIALSHFLEQVKRRGGEGKSNQG